MKHTVHDTLRPAVGKRLFALDVLRGLAAWLVLFRHAPTLPNVPDSGGEWLFRLIREVGWSGVDLFFVLSGFLIANLLFAEHESRGRIDLQRFWMRRGIKIWPSYFFAYGAIVVFWCLRDWGRGKYELVWNHLYNSLPNALFVQNYVHCDPWSHSWSLAVEEHFYITLPLLLTLAFSVISQLNWSRRSFAFACLCFAIGVASITLAGRCYQQSIELGWKHNYYPTHLRCDALMWGVALAALYRYVPELQRYTRFWLTTGLLALCSGLWLIVAYPLESNGPAATYGFTLLFCGYGSLVLAAAVYPESGAESAIWPLRWLTRSLAWVGVYSYTVYLAHATVYGIPGMASVREIALSIAARHGGVSIMWLAWLDRALFWGLSILGGVMLSHLVERPFLILRSRFFPSKSSSSSGHAESFVAEAHSGGSR